MSWTPTPKMRRWWLRIGKNELPYERSLARFVIAVKRFQPASSMDPNCAKEGTLYEIDPGLLKHFERLVLYKVSNVYCRHIAVKKARKGKIRSCAKWMSRATYARVFNEFVKKSGHRLKFDKREWTAIHEQALDCAKRARKRTVFLAGDVKSFVIMLNSSSRLVEPQ